MKNPEFTFRYKIRNWPEYSRALVRRGQLTLWFDETSIAGWRDAARPNGPGRPMVYANAAIECTFVLKSVFHLSLRATQVFFDSAVTLMGLELPVPSYSTMSRRQAGLAVSLHLQPCAVARHVVIDATGLKVYGAGEWHAGKHKGVRRRSWRKLHLGVDETTKEILAGDVTESRVHDSLRLPTLLLQIHRSGLRRPGLRYPRMLRGRTGAWRYRNHRAATKRTRERRIAPTGLACGTRYNASGDRSAGPLWVADVERLHSTEFGRECRVPFQSGVGGQALGADR